MDVSEFARFLIGLSGVTALIWMVTLGIRQAWSSVQRKRQYRNSDAGAQEDWYRQTKWNTRIRDAFFQKLARARSQRDQYLVIQAGVLNYWGYHRDALELVDLYFDTQSHDFHDTEALSTRADALFQLKRRDEAIAAYHAVLEREAAFPNLQTGLKVKYPYIVATEKIEAEYGFALRVLDENPDPGPFPLSNFMWHAAKALILDSSDHATQALAWASKKDSGFRHHKELGLVGDDQCDIVRRLRRMTERK